MAGGSAAIALRRYCGFRNLFCAFVVVIGEEKQIQKWLADLMIQLPLTVPLQEEHLPSSHVHLAVGTPQLGLRRATPVSRTCHAHKNTHTRASCCCCCDAVSLRLVVVLLRLILRSTTTAAYVALSSLVTCNEKPNKKNRQK